MKSVFSENCIEIHSYLFSYGKSRVIICIRIWKVPIFTGKLV